MPKWCQGGAGECFGGLWHRRRQRKAAARPTAKLWPNPLRIRKRGGPRARRRSDSVRTAGGRLSNPWGANGGGLDGAAKERRSWVRLVEGEREKEWERWLGLDYQILAVGERSPRSRAGGRAVGEIPVTIRVSKERGEGCYSIKPYTYIYNIHHVKLYKEPSNIVNVSQILYSRCKLHRGPSTQDFTQNNA